jgi:hypothetical protein
MAGNDFRQPFCDTGVQRDLLAQCKPSIPWEDQTFIFLSRGWLRTVSPLRSVLGVPQCSLSSTVNILDIFSTLMPDTYLTTRSVFRKSYPYLVRCIR